jgi:hypothetical protein
MEHSPYPSFLCSSLTFPVLFLLTKEQHLEFPLEGLLVAIGFVSQLLFENV